MFPMQISQVHGSVHMALLLGLHRCTEDGVTILQLILYTICLTLLFFLPLKTHFCGDWYSRLHAKTPNVAPSGRPL